MSFLNEADQNYREAKVFTRFEIPGEYNVEIKKIRINNEKECVNWQMVILDGDFKNELVTMAHFFSKKSIWRYKQDMLNIGLEIPPSRFASYIEKIVGMKIKIRITVTHEEETGKVYVNTSFEENLNKDDAPDFAPAKPSQVEEEDDPFQ